MTIKSRAAIKAEVNGEIVTNGTGAITASIVNGILNDVADSTLIGAGAWVSTTAYSIGDVVSYLGTSYLCQIANTNITPGTNINYWQPMTGVTGPTGPAPWGQPTAWAASTAYVAGLTPSCVIFNGSLFLCSVAHMSGSSFDPTKWVLITAGNGNTLSFDSRAAMVAFLVPAWVTRIIQTGYSAPGDRGYREMTRAGAPGPGNGYEQTADGSWWVTASLDLYPEMFGAKGDNSTDDTTAIQTAINVALDRYLNGMGVSRVVLTRTYKITSPLLIFRIVAGAFQYVSISIVGLPANAGYGAVGAPGLTMTSLSLPAIIQQAGRSVKYEGFSITGPTGATLATYAQLVDDYGGSSNPWYNPNANVRDHQYSPQCGIAIDPFAASVPSDGGYPGLSSYYVQNNGSSITHITGVEIYKCIVGVMMSSSGGSQNDDFVHIDRCLFSNCKIGVAIGQDQSRSCSITKSAFEGAKIAIDGKIYGNTIGVMPNVANCGFVYVQALLNVDASRGLAGMTGCYAESTFSIGYCGTGYLPITFENCDFKLIPAWNNGVKGIDCHFVSYCPVSFVGGAVRTYTGNPDQLYFFVGFGADLTIDGTTFEDCPIITNSLYSRIRNMPLYSVSGPGAREMHCDTLANMAASGRQVRMPQGAKIVEQGDRAWQEWTSQSGPIVETIETASITVNSNGTASFTAADAGAYQVGDTLTTPNSSTTMTQGWNASGAITATFTGTNACIGRVSSIVGTTISLAGVPNWLVTAGSGSRDIGRFRFPSAKQRSIGTLAASSNSVSGVGNISTWAVGDFVRTTSTLILPPGTRVTQVNVGLKTLTLSRNALQNATAAPLYDAYLNLRALVQSAPSTGVWWKGDAFDLGLSGNTLDGNNEVLSGYICTTTGDFAQTPPTITSRYEKATSP